MFNYLKLHFSNLYNHQTKIPTLIISMYCYVFESSIFTIPTLFIQLHSSKFLSKFKIITLNLENS